MRRFIAVAPRTGMKVSPKHTLPSLIEQRLLGKLGVIHHRLERLGDCLNLYAVEKKTPDQVLDRAALGV